MHKSADAKEQASPVRNPQNQSSLSSQPSPIQRKAAKSPLKGSRDSSSSQGLPQDLQENMEHSFQTDLSNVKVHQKSPLASQLGAKAFARGNEVHFAPGQFQPHNRAGRNLIGHEVAHVVQQRQGRVPTTAVQAKGWSVNESPALEREADQWGEMAVHGREVLRTPLGESKVGGKVAQFYGVEPEVREREVDEESGTTVITVHVDADGDQVNKELFLKFVHQGLTVTLYAGPAKLGENGLQEVMQFKTNSNTNFDISNQFSGGGIGAYRIWFGAENLELKLRPSKKDIYNTKDDPSKINYYFWLNNRSTSEEIKQSSIEINKADVEEADILSIRNQSQEQTEKEAERSGFRKKTIYFQGGVYNDLFSAELHQNIIDPTLGSLLLMAHYGPENKNSVFWPRQRIDVPIPANNQTKDWFLNLNLKVVDEGNFIAIYFNRPDSDPKHPVYYPNPSIRIFINVRAKKIEKKQGKDADYSEKLGYYSAIESRQAQIKVQVTDQNTQSEEIQAKNKSHYNRIHTVGSQASGSNFDNDLKYTSKQDHRIRSKFQFQVEAGDHAFEHLDQVRKIESFSAENEGNVMAMQRHIRTAYEVGLIDEGLHQKYINFFLTYYGYKSVLDKAEKARIDWLEHRASNSKSDELYQVQKELWLKDLAPLHEALAQLFVAIHEAKIFPNNRGKSLIYKHRANNSPLLHLFMTFEQYHLLPMTLTRDLLQAMQKGYQNRAKALAGEKGYGQETKSIYEGEAQSIEKSIQSYTTVHEEFWQQFKESSSPDRIESISTDYEIVEYVQVQAIFYPESLNIQKTEVTGIPLKVICFKVRDNGTGRYWWYIANLTNGHWHDYLPTTEGGEVTAELFRLMNDADNLPKGYLIYKTEKLHAVVEMTTPQERDAFWRTLSLVTAGLGVAAMLIFPPAAPFLFGISGVFNGIGAGLKWVDDSQQGHLTNNEMWLSIAEIASGVFGGVTTGFTFANTATRLGSKTLIGFKGAQLAADVTVCYVSQKDYWEKYSAMKKAGIKIDDISYITFGILNGLMGVYACYSQGADIVSSLKNRAIYNHMAQELYGTTKFKDVHGSKSGAQTPEMFDGLKNSSLDEAQRKAITDNFTYEEIYAYIKKGQAGEWRQQSESLSDQPNGVLQMSAKQMLHELADASLGLKSNTIEGLKLKYPHVHSADLMFYIKKYKGKPKQLEEALKNHSQPKGSIVSWTQTSFSSFFHKKKSKFKDLKSSVTSSKDYARKMEDAIEDLKGINQDASHDAFERGIELDKFEADWETRFFVAKNRQDFPELYSTKTKLIEEQTNLEKLTLETVQSKVGEIRKRMEAWKIELKKGGKDINLSRNIDVDFYSYEVLLNKLEFHSSPFYFTNEHGFKDFYYDPRLTQNRFRESFQKEFIGLSAIVTKAEKASLGKMKKIRTVQEEIVGKMNSAKWAIQAQKNSPSSAIAKQYWSKKSSFAEKRKLIKQKESYFSDLASKDYLSDFKVKESKMYHEMRIARNEIQGSKIYAPKVNHMLYIKEVPAFNWEVLRDLIKGTIGLGFTTFKAIGVNTTAGLFKGVRKLLGYFSTWFNSSYPNLEGKLPLQALMMKIHDGFFYGDMTKEEMSFEFVVFMMGQDEFLSSLDPDEENALLNAMDAYREKLSQNQSTD